jgi:hypothetical protein
MKIMTPITLHEDDYAKIVQLAGQYSTDWGTSIEEFKVVFHQSGNIELFRFKNEGGDKQVIQFTMSDEETFALFSAWETRRAEQELKRHKEEERIAGIVAQVHATIADTSIILEEHPASETGTRYWELLCSEVEGFCYRVTDADMLMVQACHAKGVYSCHVSRKGLIEEAYALAADCPAIQIIGSKDPNYMGDWHVLIIPEPEYNCSAYTAEQLLAGVKCARAKYEKWQAEQLIKQND